MVKAAVLEAAVMDAGTLAVTFRMLTPHRSLLWIKTARVGARSNNHSALEANASTLHLYAFFTSLLSLKMVNCYQASTEY